MHVSARPAVVGLLLVFGCDGSKRPPPPPIISSAIVTDGGGLSKRESDAPNPRFVAAGKQAQEAAEKIARKCTIYGGFSEVEGDFKKFHDACSWKKTDLEPLRAAAAAVRQSAPDAGPGSLYAEHVRLFSEWIEEASNVSLTQGTLAHYQDLALAWNAFQPKQRVQVDVGAKGSYLDDPDTVPFPKSDEEKGVYVQWQRCSDGPCVVVSNPKKKKK